MKGRNEICPVSGEEFLPAVQNMRREAWRLVQICAVCAEEGYELSYSFFKEYEMVTLRLAVRNGAPVPTVTQAYPCGFLQEQEMEELFGVKIDRNSDQDMEAGTSRRLYRIRRDAPFQEKR